MQIVLIDDDPVDRMLLERALRGVASTITITTFGDGHSALQAMRASTPSVVLVDMNMPGMDGLEFVETVRADPKLSTLPVVFISGSHLREDMMRLKERGANAYFPKPDTITGYKLLAETLRREWVKAYA